MISRKPRVGQIETALGSDLKLHMVNFARKLAANEAVPGGGRRVKLSSDWTPAVRTRIQTATITGAASLCRTLQRLRFFTTVCTVLFVQGNMRPLESLMLCTARAD